MKQIENHDADVWATFGSHAFLFWGVFTLWGQATNVKQGVLMSFGEEQNCVTEDPNIATKMFETAAFPLN